MVGGDGVGEHEEGSSYHDIAREVFGDLDLEVEGAGTDSDGEILQYSDGGFDGGVG
jgi:hypothetical protein